MTKSILLIGAAFLILCSCTEECKENNVGTYCFKNPSSYAVTIEFGDRVVSLSPLETECEEFSPGTYGFMSSQDTASGNFQYGFGTIDVVQCTQETLELY